jgi:ABC-2 type transport system permease protein
MAMSAAIQRFRTAAWLGWQVEANWADPLVFVVYAVSRPLAVALILAGMYWAVRGTAVHQASFLGFFVANAFHTFVTTVLVGMGWVVVEEREEYETLKYVYTSPIGMFTWLLGRSAVKLAVATLSVVLTLAVGWVALGLRWDWSATRWLPLLAALPLGLVACVFLGFLVAGWALLLPRAAISGERGRGGRALPAVRRDLPDRPAAARLAAVSLALPFTYWYEALRRFLLGHGSSAMLAGWSDATLLLALALSTLVFVLVSRWGYFALEREARRRGRLDQTTLF